MQYMLAGEESRLGFQDYWRDGFLARHTPAGRSFLEKTKVVFLFALYAVAVKGISLL